MSAFSRLTWSHTCRYLTLLLLAMSCTALQAHVSSTAYLNLEPNSAESTADHTYNAQYELALRDLALLVDIDSNQDSQVSWAEIKSQKTLIEQLITAQVTLEAGAQSCKITNFAPLAINTRGGFNYLYTDFELGCAASISELNYQILAGVDANHRLILTQADSDLPIQVLAVGQSPIGADADTGWLFTATSFMKNGIHHLLIGEDHLLFLFVLMIPAVYLRNQKNLVPVTKPRAALIEVLWIATSFTVAHSITLSLAALQVVSISERFIESLIALTIVFAAVNNIVPLLRVRATYVAFAFGLVHGFGFANVLVDLPLATSERVLALLSFNVGIEMGQLLFILVVFPIALLLRYTRFYKFVIFYAGSMFSVLIALWWFAERAFLS